MSKPRPAVVDRERLVYVQADMMVIRDGVEVWLTPRENDVMRLLCERLGHFRTADEFMAALWPTTLNDSIARVYLDKLAWKLAGATAWVQNRPWHGYRLTGEIEVI